MKLIADIGGTTSRWLQVDEGMSSLVKLQGYNPVARRTPGFIAGLDKLAPEAVKEIFIYCAGCGNEERRIQVKELAAQVFTHATITVYSDLLAVARALLGSTLGMVAILGTGMNVAYYDGTRLTHRVPSLGYLLGDEGSGVDIGRQFLNDLFNQRIPIELLAKLFPEGSPDQGSTISEIYHHEAQNRALAGYVSPLAQEQDHEYVKELVTGAFKRFTDLIVEHHSIDEWNTISVSGGVAAGFKTLLERELRKINCEND